MPQRIVRKVTKSVDVQLPARGWKPRPYQEKLWNAMVHDGCKRAVAMWHRRAGKDWFAINLIALMAHQRVGLYWHCFPTYGQGRRVVWEGMTAEQDDYGQTYTKARKFLSAFPEELIDSYNDHEMRVRLKNGSVYQVIGMDNPDLLVGPNPIGIVTSEYSVANPKAWDYWQPILTENNGWALFIYTARGRNHGFKMFQNAQLNRENGWFAELLTIEDTYRYIEDKAVRDENGQPRSMQVPIVTQEQLNQLRREGKEEGFLQQEFYNSFDAPMSGSFYGTQMSNLLAAGKITNTVHYDPSLPVITAWDLGVNDSTAIWFAQQVGVNEVRLIDYFEDANEGLAHYISIVRSKGFDFLKHIAPWDFMTRDHNNRTRYDIALKLGVRFIVLPKDSVADGIEAARMLLPRCVFNLDKCKGGIEALREYRKEWDEKNDCYRDKPVHDKASNGSDAFRYLAMGLKYHTDVDLAQLPDSYAEEDSFLPVTNSFFGN